MAFHTFTAAWFNHELNNSFEKSLISNKSTKGEGDNLPRHAPFIISDKSNFAMWAASGFGSTTW